MTKSETLVFFGNEHLSTGLPPSGTPTLKGLIAGGYLVAAIVTQHSPGHSRQPRELEVAKVAQEHNIPLLVSLPPDSLKEQLKAFQPTLGVLAAHGQIVPKDILDLFPKGIINIHPSLLPLYRGPSPIEQVILDGATTTGVSLMKLRQEMDSGPIYAQVSMDLSAQESKQDLAARLLKLGSELLLEKLPSIINNSLPTKPQDDSKATYTHLLTKEDGVVDWSKPSKQIEREVRAYLGWPKSRAKIHDRDIIITKARVATSEKDGVLVMKCNPGWLEIQQLTGPTGRTMSGADFLRGYQK